MPRSGLIAAAIAPGILGDLDAKAAINSGLIWCLGSHEVGSELLGVELVSRNSGTLGGTAAFDATHPDEAAWRGLDCKVLDDHWVVAITEAFQTDLEGANIYSIAAYVEIVSVETGSVIMSLPYNDNSWTLPYSSIRLSRAGTSNTDVRSQWADGASSSREFRNTSGDMWRPGAPHWMVATRDGSAHLLALDGVEQDSDNSVIGGVVDFKSDGSSKIVIGTRNDQSLSESTVMKVHALGIWSRELSSSEISSLNSDPTQMFIT